MTNTKLANSLGSNIGTKLWVDQTIKRNRMRDYSTTVKNKLLKQSNNIYLNIDENGAN